VAKDSLMKRLADKYGAELKKKLLDPVFFIENVIGEEGELLKLTPFQKEWIRLAEKYKRINLLAFRSSGKSEILMVCYPIFKAFVQSRSQTLVVSASQPQSSEILKRIRDRILFNEVLRSAVPSNRSSAWSKTELELKNGSRIISKSITSQIVGYHVDLIVCDEIGYYREHGVYETAVPPMVTAKDGTILCVGTPTSMVDLPHKLMKNKAYTSKIYPVKTKNSNLWKERYPDKDMAAKRREYDSITWSREFMCRPISSEDQIFPYDLIEKTFDYARPLDYHYDKRFIYYMGIDFALSGATGADFTVFTILERDPKDNTLRLKMMERYKGLGYMAQKKRIQQLYEIFHPIKTIVDEGTFGKSFLQELRSAGIAMTGYKFTNQTKQELIMNLRNAFETEKLLINNLQSHVKTVKTVKDLVKELLNFGVKLTKTGQIGFEGLGAHDDMVISFALAVFCGRSFTNSATKFHVFRGSGRKRHAMKKSNSASVLITRV
jgi:hypothetical protein